MSLTNALSDSERARSISCLGSALCGISQIPSLLPIQSPALAPLAVYLLLGDLPRTADGIYEPEVFLILYYGHRDVLYAVTVEIIPLSGKFHLI